MKNSTKITLSAIMAAMATVFMLFSYFPYLTYAIPAIAGLFIMVLVIEIDKKWAIMAYLVSCVLVFLFAEPESKLMYICFFGYYPILKAAVDSIKKSAVEWIIKIAVFNTAVALIYLFFLKLFGISLEDFGVLGRYGVYILLCLGNVVFVLYDIAVSRMAMLYMNLLHSRIRQLIK